MTKSSEMGERLGLDGGEVAAVLRVIPGDVVLDLTASQVEALVVSICGAVNRVHDGLGEPSSSPPIHPPDAREYLSRIRPPKRG